MVTFFASRVKSPPNPRLAAALYSEALKIGAFALLPGNPKESQERKQESATLPLVSPNFLFFIFSERWGGGGGGESR